jgi:hypothetical protein
MHRFRLFLVALALFSIVGVAPALAQSETPEGNQPAVILEDDSDEAEDEAWTFRFLVPTLIGGSGLVLLAVVLGYGVRIRGRYRVTQ